MSVYIHNCSIKKYIWDLLHTQGEDIIKREPMLQHLVEQTILMHHTYGNALAYRLALKLGGQIVTSDFLYNIFVECLQLSRETGRIDEDIERLGMEDLINAEKHDHSCRSVAQVLLYFKGYKAIQCYRMAHVLWKLNRKDLAMMIQARSTEVFGVDIHPGADIGGGLMIDHGTGVVIGETCIIGRNCTFLHGVTLGGTGKSTSFDRHPKLGSNVFLGCQSTILGNISIGDNCTIGSGSLVLKPLPAGATAVGSPAVIKQITANLLTIDANGQKEEIEGSIRLWVEGENWAPKIWRD